MERHSDLQHSKLRNYLIIKYKKKALYKSGMKPLARSLIYDKDWKRSSYACEYYANEMRIEGRKSKYYKTLGFKYDFNFDNDTVQFCSCFPYTYTTLCNWMSSLESPKVFSFR